METVKKREVKKVKGLGLRESTWDALDKLAQRSGRSRNNYIEQVINQHLAQRTI